MGASKPQADRARHGQAAIFGSDLLAAGYAGWLRGGRRFEAQGWPKLVTPAREKAQWSDTDKEKRADVVLDNSGSPEELTLKVEDLVKKLVE